MDSDDEEESEGEGDIVVNYTNDGIDSSDDEDEKSDIGDEGNENDTCDNESDNDCTEGRVSDQEDLSNLFVHTRSGRLANSWRCTYFI